MSCSVVGREMPLLAHHPLLLIAFKRIGLAPHLGTIVMPILLVGTQVKSAVSFCEWDSSPHTLCLPCDGEEEGKMPSHSKTLAANERDRARESEPCTLPGKHRRADSIDGGVGELASRI